MQTDRIAELAERIETDAAGLLGYLGDSGEVGSGARAILHRIAGDAAEIADGSVGIERGEPMPLAAALALLGTACVRRGESIPGETELAERGAETAAHFAEDAAAALRSVGAALVEAAQPIEFDYGGAATVLREAARFG